MELVDFIEKFAEQFDDVDVEQLNSATNMLHITLIIISLLNKICNYF